MTPAEFSTHAEIVAGKHWRSKLPPIIGRGRLAVWCWANGKRKVPVPIELLLEQLVASRRAKANQSQEQQQ